MKSSTELTRQIDQLTRDIKGIEASMPVIYEKGSDHEQEDAEVRLVACQNRLKRLQAHLTTAQQEEAAAAERARRQANTDAMEAAKTAHKDISERLSSRQLALIRHVTAELDKLDPLGIELQVLRNEVIDAWVRNNPERIRDFDNYPQLPLPALDLTDREKLTQDALITLYSKRLGSFTPPRLDPPQPNLTQPNSAVDDAMSFLDRRANGGDD